MGAERCGRGICKERKTGQSGIRGAPVGAKGQGQEGVGGIIRAAHEGEGFGAGEGVAQDAFTNMSFRVGVVRVGDARRGKAGRKGLRGMPCTC